MNIYFVAKREPWLCKLASFVTFGQGQVNLRLWIKPLFSDLHTIKKKTPSMFAAFVISLANLQLDVCSYKFNMQIVNDNIV